MVLVGLLVSEIQIRGPRDDIAKRVIRVLFFGIIKLLKLSLKIFWNDLIVYSKREI